MSELAINVVIGAIFCVLGVAGSRYEDIFRFFKFLGSPPSYLCRKKWHTYHYTRDEDGVSFVRYELWSIKKTRTGRFQVDTTDPDRPNLAYVGELTFEESNILLVLHQKELEETAFIRLKKPLGGKLERTYGLYSTIDFTHHEYCSIIMVSAEPVDEKEASEKLALHADLKSMPTGMMLAKA